MRRLLISPWPGCSGSSSTVRSAWPSASRPAPCCSQRVLACRGLRQRAPGGGRLTLTAPHRWFGNFLAAQAHGIRGDRRLRRRHGPQLAHRPLAEARGRRRAAGARRRRHRPFGARRPPRRATPPRRAASPAPGPARPGGGLRRRRRRGRVGPGRHADPPRRRPGRASPGHRVGIGRRAARHGRRERRLPGGARRSGRRAAARGRAAGRRVGGGAVRPGWCAMPTPRCWVSSSARCCW